jgi:rhodanese-related sulfurtransferase
VGVYPAHGAGSLCGRNISKETSSTIGEQRRSNYALQPMTREEFVRLTTADLPEQPRYFGVDVELNREGALPLSALPLPEALSPAELARRSRAGAIVVDVRSAAAFGAGHVPGSVHLALRGDFASWAGILLPTGSRLLLVTDDEEGVREAVTRLARVGIEGVAGYLAGGVAAWDAAGQPLGRLEQIAVDELRDRRTEDRALLVLDVRRRGEYESGHVPGALFVPLDRLEAEAGALDPARPTAVVCAGGYRSSAASSLLRRRGFTRLANVVGGTAAWVAAGLPVEASAPTSAR